MNGAMVCSKDMDIRQLLTVLPAFGNFLLVFAVVLLKRTFKGTSTPGIWMFIGNI